MSKLFWFIVAQATRKALIFYISCLTYQIEVNQSFPRSYESIQQDNILNFLKKKNFSTTRFEKKMTFLGISFHSQVQLPQIFPP